MKLLHRDYETFRKEICCKSVVCFGSGRGLTDFCSRFIGFEGRIDLLIDNDRNKQGRCLTVCGRELKIIGLTSFIELSEQKESMFVLLITTSYHQEILEQLEETAKSSPFLRNIPIYISYDIIMIENALSFDRIVYDEATYKEIVDYRKYERPVIPKRLYYVWFSRKPFPDVVKKCIDSWYKYCSDYEIIEINEDSFDVRKYDYAKEAYDEGKWAFVSDVARLDIIYLNGGIYVDTDVELLKPLDDLLYNDAFFGWQDNIYVADGLGFGAKKNHTYIAEMLDYYKNRHFRRKDGSLDVTACPIHQTPIFRRHGLRVDGLFQILPEAVVYPPIYFSGKSIVSGLNYANEKTYAIHHYSKLWDNSNNVSRDVLRDTKEKSIFEAYSYSSKASFV